MRVGVLTSSRADYSIYFPLLKEMKNDMFFDVDIIAFGTHLSEKHGKTVDQIFADGFKVPYQIKTLIDGNSPEAVSGSMGQTISNFATLWHNEKFDLVFCLGDRYEMFAACASGVPFNVKFAHIHGGEQTMGAIDEVFRHSITHMSAIHFTSTQKYAERVVELKHDTKHIYNVGALSMDNLKAIPLLSVEAFREKFGIDLSLPSILITLHPETVSYEKNEGYVDTLTDALKHIEGYQFIITMPNADTMGDMIRKKLGVFIANHPAATGVESFGTVGYLSCMKYCNFMLGNTSSGLIEASFFPKYVINLGNRQDGRLLTSNVVTVAIEKDAILNAVAAFSSFVPSKNGAIYGNGNSARTIIDILKKVAV